MSNLCYGQKIKLEGQIIDSLNQGIANTNLIASPLLTDGDITFAIADSRGAYQLKLDHDTPYKIEIISLGYASITDTLQLIKDTRKNYILKESTEELEQVIVEAQMAMIIKEDTITYRTDKFTTGDERKLREILKKLPGVEVDPAGNVTVNGKRVDKLMVDGQDFFGGDTRLGVNNIPANAVEEVEAIDNYNEVAFMKGLSDSDKMAMNIKLKEGKKDFVFGETEIGGGVKKRYYLHPSVFYYSPNTSINFIGSLNNTNDAPLDFEDVERFKGGYLSFLDNPIRSGDTGLNQFSQNPDALHKKMQFGALNINQKISPSVRIDAYSIAAQQETRNETAAHTEYLTQDNLIEDRENKGKNSGFTNFNKIKLRYIPSSSKDLAYDILANVSNRLLSSTLKSKARDSLNHISTELDPHRFELHQYLRYNTQPTYEHTSEIRAEHSYRKTNHGINWNFDRPIFSGIIPFQKDKNTEDYNLQQDYSSLSQAGRVHFKHYWVLNNVNHIYPVAGLYFFDQTYRTKDYQRFQDGNINDFTPHGFNNDTQYRLIDPYIGFQYKFKLGKVIFRPGLVYHHYFWRVNQFSERIISKNKGVFLPEFKLEHENKNGQKLEFNYNVRSHFSDAQQYANRLTLRSFNRLYQGNEDIENSLYHLFSLNYRHLRISTGLYYNLNLSYRRREKSPQVETLITGIDQISKGYYNSFPENTYTFSGALNKRWQKVSAGLSAQTSFSDYRRIINLEKLDYQSSNFNYSLHIQTLFNKLPNINVGFKQSFNNVKNQNFKNRYLSISPFIGLEYSFLNGFTLNSNYLYNHTKDRTAHQTQNFQIGNASLFYRKEGSPWGFEIRVDNAFDVRYKRQHHVNEFIVYDQRVFIQPRIVLFILSYQL